MPTRPSERGRSSCNEPLFVSCKRIGKVPRSSQIAGSSQRSARLSSWGCSTPAPSRRSTWRSSICRGRCWCCARGRSILPCRRSRWNRRTATASAGRRRSGALLHLKERGFVVLALDGVQGPGLPVSCLGQRLELARGPFALARLSGAPLCPLVARWERGRIGIVVGDELAAKEGEEAFAAAAARWLERYLVASPVEVRLGLLRVFSTPPPPRATPSPGTSGTGR